MRQQTQHSFARVVGRRPRVRGARFQLIDSPHLLAETFGPAELQNRKKSALIYWNFVRDDGVADFTLVARLRPKIKPSEVQVRLVANSGFRSFRDWAIDRLCAVEGGEETPLFINSEAFVIERLG